eukprot:m51a1_g3905 hypothetical protein (1184) ;mRNA; r:123684-128601
MKALLALLLSAAFVAVVRAAPFRGGPIDLPLADGSSLQVWVTGDEFTGARYVDSEGHRVFLSEDGYASFFDSQLGAPGAPLMSRRHAEQQARYAARDLPPEWDNEANQRRARFNQELGEAAAKRSRARSTEPLLFVLVQYSNFPTKAATKDHINKAVFGDSTDGTTVNSYYRINSKGKFQFTRAQESSDVKDDGIIGPVTIGCPWLNHTKWGVYPDYSCLQREGLLGAAPFINLKSFDTNNDKVISGSELHIVLVIAGGDLGSLAYTPKGISKCPHVWGFMQPGSAFQVQSQGVTFGEHVIIGENWGDNCDTPFVIGTVSHELAHTMTVPDLYSLDPTGESIVGPWCLMDGGNWNNYGNNPGMMSPFVRQYLGWLTPTKVTGTASLTLKPTAVDPDQVLQFGDNPNGADWEWNAHKGVGEYFLVENRQKVGVDTYLRGSGVLVWHVNEAAPITSSHLSANSWITRLQRHSQAIQSVSNTTDDVLTDSVRQSIYCGFNSAAPNTILDNDGKSCVSLSASVDTTTRVATIEPYTDSACSSCTFGQDGVASPTQEYNVIERFGFQLAQLQDATAVTFTNGFATVSLPWAVPFFGGSYKKMFIAAKWVKTGLTFQAVISSKGDIYFVYSGSDTTGSFKTFVSPGVDGVTTDAGTYFGKFYSWANPSKTPAALQFTPKPIGLTKLPWTTTFDTADWSASWFTVLNGQVDNLCGSSSGKALLFTPEAANHFAMPYGFDVSGCANVSVSFVVGPSTNSTGCNPVASRIFLGFTFGSLRYPPSWPYADVGQYTSTIAVPKNAGSFYISFNYMGEGMIFIDDFSVTCATQSASSSSAHATSSTHTTSSAHTASSSKKSGSHSASSPSVVAHSSRESSSDISGSSSLVVCGTVLVIPAVHLDEIDSSAWPEACFVPGVCPERNPRCSSWRVGGFLECVSWKSRPDGAAGMRSAEAPSLWQVRAVRGHTERRCSVLLQWVLRPREPPNLSDSHCYTNVFRCVEVRATSASDACWRPAEVCGFVDGELVSNEFAMTRREVEEAARVVLPLELWDPRCETALRQLHLKRVFPLELLRRAREMIEWKAQALLHFNPPPVLLCQGPAEALGPVQGRKRGRSECVDDSEPSAARAEAHGVVDSPKEHDLVPARVGGTHSPPSPRVSKQRRTSEENLDLFSEEWAAPDQPEHHQELPSGH